MALDFRVALPYPDQSFQLVAFDPPHIVRAGPRSWLAAKYGKLSEVLALTPHQPLFGNRSGRKAGTHWLVFMKPMTDQSPALDGGQVNMGEE